MLRHYSTSSGMRFVSFLLLTALPFSAHSLVFNNNVIEPAAKKDSYSFVPVFVRTSICAIGGGYWKCYCTAGVNNLAAAKKLPSTHCKDSKGVDVDKLTWPAKEMTERLKVVASQKDTGYKELLDILGENFEIEGITVDDAFVTPVVTKLKGELDKLDEKQANALNREYLQQLADAGGDFAELSLARYYLHDLLKPIKGDEAYNKAYCGLKEKCSAQFARLKNMNADDRDWNEWDEDDRVREEQEKFVADRKFDAEIKKALDPNNVEDFEKAVKDLEGQLDALKDDGRFGSDQIEELEELIAESKDEYLEKMKTASDSFEEITKEFDEKKRDKKNRNKVRSLYDKVMNMNPVPAELKEKEKESIKVCLEETKGEGGWVCKGGSEEITVQGIKQKWNVEMEKLFQQVQNEKEEQDIQKLNSKLEEFHGISYGVDTKNAGLDKQDFFKKLKALQKTMLSLSSADSNTGCSFFGTCDTIIDKHPPTCGGEGNNKGFWKTTPCPWAKPWNLKCKDSVQTKDFRENWDDDEEAWKCWFGLESAKESDNWIDIDDKKLWSGFDTDAEAKELWRRASDLNFFIKAKRQWAENKLLVPLKTDFKKAYRTIVAKAELVYEGRDGKDASSADLTDADGKDVVTPGCEDEKTTMQRKLTEITKAPAVPENKFLQEAASDTKEAEDHCNRIKALVKFWTVFKAFKAIDRSDNQEQVDLKATAAKEVVINYKSLMGKRSAVHPVTSKGGLFDGGSGGLFDGGGVSNEDWGAKVKDVAIEIKELTDDAETSIKDGDDDMKRLDIIVRFNRMAWAESGNAKPYLTEAINDDYVNKLITKDEKEGGRKAFVYEPLKDADVQEAWRVDAGSNEGLDNLPLNAFDELLAEMDGYFDKKAEWQALVDKLIKSANAGRKERASDEIRDAMTAANTAVNSIPNAADKANAADFKMDDESSKVAQAGKALEAFRKAEEKFGNLKKVGTKNPGVYGVSEGDTLRKGCQTYVRARWTYLKEVVEFAQLDPNLAKKCEPVAAQMSDVVEYATQFCAEGLNELEDWRTAHSARQAEEAKHAKDAKWYKTRKLAEDAVNNFPKEKLDLPCVRSTASGACQGVGDLQKKPQSWEEIMGAWNADLKFTQDDGEGYFADMFKDGGKYYENFQAVKKYLENSPLDDLNDKIMNAYYAEDKPKDGLKGLIAFTQWGVAARGLQSWDSDVNSVWGQKMQDWKSIEKKAADRQKELTDDQWYQNIGSVLTRGRIKSTSGYESKNADDAKRKGAKEKAEADVKEILQEPSGKYVDILTQFIEIVKKDNQGSWDNVRYNDKEWEHVEEKIKNYRKSINDALDKIDNLNGNKNTKDLLNYETIKSNLVCGCQSRGAGGYGYQDKECMAYDDKTKNDDLKLTKGVYAGYVDLVKKIEAWANEFVAFPRGGAEIGNGPDDKANGDQYNWVKDKILDDNWNTATQASGNMENVRCS